MSETSEAHQGEQYEPHRREEGAEKKGRVSVTLGDKEVATHVLDFSAANMSTVKTVEKNQRGLRVVLRRPKLAEQASAEHLNSPRLAVRDPIGNPVTDAKFTQREPFSYSSSSDAAEQLSHDDSDCPPKITASDEPQGEGDSGVERRAGDAEEESMSWGELRRGR